MDEGREFFETIVVLRNEKFELVEESAFVDQPWHRWQLFSRMHVG